MVLLNQTIKQKKINLENIQAKTKISYKIREDKSNLIHAYNLKLL